MKNLLKRKILLVLSIIFCLSNSAYVYTQPLSITLSSDTNYVCNGVGCNYEGPSILINEVMMKPTNYDGSIYGIGPNFSPDSNRGEWIELYNPDLCQSVDISCYYLGNNIPDGPPLTPIANYPGGFVIPEGTIIPPRGFCLIRGVNAPPVPNNLLVQNGGNTVEIVVNDPAKICLGGGYKLWFSNAGGWFAFYDRNGVPQDAISWATQQGIANNPCNPGPIGACSYSGGLQSYNQIPADRKTMISANEPTQGLSFRRNPDGGPWAINQPATPTMGTCNSTCIPAPVITCVGEDSVNASGGTAPYSYLWDDGMAQTTQTATGLCAGTYCVTVTDANNNTASGCVTVNNYELPVSITPADSTVCPNEPVILTANGADIYNWNQGLGSENPKTVSPAATTTYSVTGTDTNDCSGTASATVYVEDSIPYVEFVASPLEGCIPLEVQFADHSPDTNIVEWYWEFGDGGTSSEQNPLHIYTQSGQYDVTLTLTDSNGCIASADSTDYINVWPQPIADFYTIPDIGTIYAPTLTFYSSTNAQYWIWIWGDGDTSYSAPPVSHTYPPIEEDYEVTLIVSNEYGCADTITKIVKIIDDVPIFPNIITPNGDGINDFLVIVNAEKYPNTKLLVFNRWGKKVYEHINYDNSWKGGNLSDGTYYYIFEYLADKSYHGSLTIIRN